MSMLGPRGVESGHQEYYLEGGNLAMLVCGCVVLLMTLPMIFLNERKMARIYMVLSRAKAECIPLVPINMTRKHQTNFKLVHCVGRNNTDAPVEDVDFGVAVEQAIRVVRRVEMLQWVEIKREEQSSEGNKTWYEYAQQWSTKVIDHHVFDQQKGHENPRVMACQNDTFSCEKAYLGLYSLNLSQIARLTNTRDFRPNDEQKDEILGKTDGWLHDLGFERLTYKTQYFETKPVDDLARDLAPGIGTTRISWLYVPCGTMTVMAQQMQKENDKTHQSEFTFRKWNPSHVDATWGSDNSNSLDPCCPMVFFIWYFIEVLCFPLIFNETIDHCACGK